jgi:hypothetical protein
MELAKGRPFKYKKALFLFHIIKIRIEVLVFFLPQIAIISKRVAVCHESLSVGSNLLNIQQVCLFKHVQV